MNFNTGMCHKLDWNALLVKIMHIPQEKKENEKQKDSNRLCQRKCRNELELNMMKDIKLNICSQTKSQ